MPTRLWIDADIGSEPSRAAALLFAHKHPGIELVGISLSGSQQDKRYNETQEILGEINARDIEVFRGDEVTAHDVNETNPDATLTLGPLSNIARLILEEASIGQLFSMSSMLRHIYFRNTYRGVDPNIEADLDAARIVLSQYEAILCTFEASTQLILDPYLEKQHEEKYAFLHNRIVGYRDYLTEKFGVQYSSIVFGDLLGVCAILNIPTLTTETIECVFQSDGSLLSTHIISQAPEPIVAVENTEGLPTPRIKQKFVRSVDAMRVYSEYMAAVGIEH